MPQFRDESAFGNRPLMPSRQRLAAAGDFRILFSRGVRIETPLFRLVWRRNNLPRSRFAFVVSKTVAKRAVARNRLRRRTREWYQKQAHRCAASVDLIIIFKREAAQATRASLYEELERASLPLFHRT